MILYPKFFDETGIFIDYGCKKIVPFNERFIILPYLCSNGNGSRREWLNDIDELVKKYYPDRNLNLLKYYEEQ